MKVLIWTKNISLKNMGGPMGYCYNIKSYLDEHPCEEIDFYPGSQCGKGAGVCNGTKSIRIKIKLYIRKLFAKIKFIDFLLTLNSLYIKHFPLSEKDKSLLEKYDFVHVHCVNEFLQSFYNFNGKRTKIILTTHTPEPLIDELAGRFGMLSLLKLFPFVRNFFLKKEIEAYKKADLVMFPVPEAKEPYISRSPYYKNLFKLIESKIFYVPTAINKLKTKPENKHSLDKYSISSNALKVCYVGRHNEVKGYNMLKQIAVETWKNIPNVYFIIGGKEEPLKGIKDSRWIELGWVNTSELLNEVDIFILPNKETYFDIILLEVLRQGIPVVISKTGGNKWFEDKNISGIHCYNYDDKEECSRILKQLYDDKNKGLLIQQKIANEQFFKENSYMPVYIEKYLKSLREYKGVDWLMDECRK